MSGVRYALRSLRRSRGFTIVAVLTLGLGIGANTGMFSVVNAVLLRPLPYEEPDRLARVFSLHQGDLWTASPPDFTDWRRDNRAFEDMAALYPSTATLSGDGPAERIPGAVVGPNLFPLLGVGPALGRGFNESDAVSGQHYVALLGHGLWQRRFGGDSSIVGRVIQLDGESYTVVGVMPAGFAYPTEAELWRPLAFTVDDLTTQRGAHYLTVTGRLRAGVRVEDAAAEMEALAARIEEEHPNTNLGWSATVEGLREAMIGDVRTGLLLLLGAVGLVLLIACTNVANLLLVRALERERELAVKAALGASRWRLLRSALTESLVLAILGGVVGLLIAEWGTSLLVVLGPEDLPRLDTLRIDPSVLVFTAAVSLLTGALFGTLPAVRASSEGGLGERLRSGGRGGSTDRATRLTKHGLVIAETALAVLLLAGAALLMKSFVRLQSVDPGFDTENLLSFRLGLPEVGYGEPDQARRFYHELLERIEGLPGVVAADAATGLPLTGYDYSITVYTLDGARATPDNEPLLQVRVVTSGYFANLGIPIVRGREFAESDLAGSPPVAMVNESAARMLWPEGDPLGRTLTVGTRMGLGGERVGGEVVGVVRDFKHSGLDREAAAALYVVHSQFPASGMSLVVRTAGDPQALAESIRNTITEIDPQVPMYSVRTMRQIVSTSLAQPRLFTVLFAVFAVAALALAAIGMYGVIAHAVAQRTREIGIRIALGARREEVLRMVLRRGLVLGAAGAAIGVVSALAATRVMAGLLYEVEPTDPLTLVAVPFFLIGVSLLAAFLPAYRAARVDPIRALRYE